MKTIYKKLRTKVGHETWAENEYNTTTMDNKENHRIETKKNKENLETKINTSHDVRSKADVACARVCKNRPDQRCQDGWMRVGVQRRHRNYVFEAGAFDEENSIE